MIKDLRINPLLPAKRRRSFWQDVGDNYKFIYQPGLQRLAGGHLLGFEEDPDFEVSSDMIKDYDISLQEDLIESKSKKEFDYKVNIWHDMDEVRKNLAINKSIGAGLFTGLFDPINLVPLPTVWGMGFWRGAKRLGTGAGALTAVQEGVRGYNDPHYQPIESVAAIGGSTILSGLLGGTIGAFTKKAGARSFKAQYYDDGADEVRDPNQKRIDYDADGKQSDDPLLLTYEPKLTWDGRINKTQPMPNPKPFKVDSQGNVKIPEETDFKVNPGDDVQVREQKRKVQNDVYNGQIDNNIGKRIVLKATPRNNKDKMYGNIVTLDPKDVDGMTYDELLKALGGKNSYQNWLNTLKDKNWKRFPEDDAAPETAYGYEKTMKITIFGGIVSRFKSKLSRQYANKKAGDGGISYKDSRNGDTPTGEGNVTGGTAFTNAGRWSLVELNDFIKFSRDAYQEMFTGIKETKPVLGMDVRYMSTALKNYFKNKKDKTVMTAKMFNDEVGKLIMNATRTEKFGKLDHPIPQVKKVAEKFIEKMKAVKEAGDEARFFNTKDNLSYRYNVLYNQYGEILNDIDRITGALKQLVRNPKDKNLPSVEVLNMQLYVAKLFAGRHLNNLRNMEKELFSREIQNAKVSGKLEELLESIAKQRESALETFNSIMSKGYVNIKNNPAKAVKQAKTTFEEVDELEKYVKGLLDEDIAIIKALDEESKTIPLSPELKKYYDELVNRVTNPAFYGRTKREKQLLEDVRSFKYKDTRVVGTRPQVRALNNLLEKLRKGMNPNQRAYYNNLKAGFLATTTKQKRMSSKEAYYIHRDYMVARILDHREEFEKFLASEFIKKPTGVLKSALNARKTGATKFKYNEVNEKLDDKLIQKILSDKVTRTVNKIVKDGENQNIDNIHNTGTNSFNLARSIDLPNYYFLKDYNGIADFIDTDVNKIMHSYLNRVGPNLEMARMFDGDRFGEHELYRVMEDIIYRHSSDIDKNPKQFFDAVNVHIDDNYELTNAVLGRMGMGINTGSRSNQLVQALMQFSQFTMMGMASIASFADPGKILLANGLKQTFGKQIKNWMTDLESIEARRRSGESVYLTGEGYDPRLNTAGRRVADQSDIQTNQLNRGFGKIGDSIISGVDKLASGFYNVNLLNQWTGFWKRQVGYIANDRLMRVAWHIGNKKTYDELDIDKRILAQYGLDEKKLLRIHFLWKKNQGEKLHRSGDTYYGNVDKWMDEDPDLARDYISAIRQEQINTIITPTDADKTYMHYGKLKFSHWDKGMKDRQHNVYRMPLQYMSWAFAANNKILISSLQGRHKGVMSGVVAMFAMGMLSDYIRNPGWWSYKSDTERYIKAIEYSGLTSYLLDINNIMEVMTNNNFGIRPMMGEKNPFTGTPEDIISEPFGPVGGIGAELYALFNSDMSLDRRASVIRRLIPYNNLFYLKWLFTGAQKNVVDILE